MDISVVELIVYGFIAYSSLLMLIISAIKEIPTTKSLAISRAIYLIPGMICAAILAGSGVNIDMPTTTNTAIINETTYNATGSLTFTVLTNSTAPVTSYIVLQNPVWVLVHFMIFAVLGVYVVNQALMLLTKKE